MARPPPLPVYTLKGSMLPVHCLMFDLKNNEENIYAGTRKGKVHLWDLKTNRETKSYVIGDETCLAIHKLDDTIITQEKIGCYKLWREDKATKEWNLKEKFTVKYFGFCKSVVIEKDRCIICPISDSIVKLINLDDLNNIKMTLSDNNRDENKKLGEVMVIKYFNDFVLVGYECGAIKIWSTVSSKCVNRTDFFTDCVMALDVQYFNNQNNRLFGFVGTVTDVIMEFNIDINDDFSGVLVTKKREIKITNPGVCCIKIRPDCKLFVAGCQDKRIRLFSCKSLKLLVVLDFHKDMVQDVVFSNDMVDSCSCQLLLASGSFDGKVSLWNLYN